MDPEASAVLSFGNSKTYLEEALVSLWGQTFEPLEIILVNDQSKDGSLDLVRKFMAENPREGVRLEERPGGALLGISGSRNYGAKLARGTYLAFLDADDIWHPTKIDSQVKLLQECPTAAMTYGPYEELNESKPGALQFLGTEIGLIKPPFLFMLYHRDVAYSPSPSGILVRRDCFREVGGFRTSDFKFDLYDDQAFYVKICLKYPVLVTSLQSYWYRIHPGQATARIKEEGTSVKMAEDYLVWLQDYLKRNHPEILKVVSS